MKNLKDTQIFTPEWATNDMLNMLEPASLSDPNSFFFEPSCGDGSMLIVIVKRIYEALLNDVYAGNKEAALADTLHKFYAVELDPTLVPLARQKVYDWAISLFDSPPSHFECFMIARSLQFSIECRDFFDAMEHPIDSGNGARGISRKIKKKRTP